MHNSYKEIVKANIALLLIPFTAYLYYGYRKSTSLSEFEIAAQKLGLKGYKKGAKTVSVNQHLEAFLKYFKYLVISAQKHYGKVLMD